MPIPSVVANVGAIRGAKARLLLIAKPLLKRADQADFEEFFFGRHARTATRRLSRLPASAAGAIGTALDCSDRCGCSMPHPLFPARRSRSTAADSRGGPGTPR